MFKKKMIFSENHPLLIQGSDLCSSMKCNRLYKHNFNSIKPVDIIVPIYNNFSGIKKLLPSLFTYTDLPHQFIFIDDFSSDENIYAWLTEQCKDRDDCLVLRNPFRVGFSKTVNYVTELSRGDFVLLYSNTIVPKGWLSRILKALNAAPNIALATSFSNNPILLGFPYSFHIDSDDIFNLIKHNNKFFEQFSFDEIDKVFSSLSLLGCSDVPLGIGCCMAFSRRAWLSCGGFNTQKFNGRKYKEIKDWCLRVKEKGWKQVIATNLYIAQEEEEKDSSLCSEGFLNRNIFTKDISICTKSMLWRPWRDAAWLAFTLLGSRNKGCKLFVSHSWAGGANVYLKRRIWDFVNKGETILSIEFSHITQSYKLTCYGIAEAELVLTNASPDLLLHPLFKSITHIIVNNLCGWPLFYRGRPLLEWLVELSQVHNCSLEYYFHDFYAVCPQITLSTPNGKFCRLEVDEDLCTECANTDQVPCIEYVENRFLEPIVFPHIKIWRAQWQAFLKKCSKITFFSTASQKIVEKVFDLRNILCEVVPHVPLYSFPSKYVLPSSSSPMIVVVIGNIQRHKGAWILPKLMEIMFRKDFRSRLVIIGSYKGRRLRNMSVTGAYTPNQLPTLLKKYKVTVGLIPSIWPETFSYTTQELIQLDVPLVCFDLGAPAERVKKYSKGLVAKEVNAESAYSALFELDQRCRFMHHNKLKANSYSF